MTLSCMNCCLVMANAALVRDWVLMQYLMAFKHLNLLTQTISLRHTHTHTRYIPFPFSDLGQIVSVANTAYILCCDTAESMRVTSL